MDRHWSNGLRTYSLPPLFNVGDTIRRLQTETGSSITVKTGSNLNVTGLD
ncbi:MAG: hypothetical protein V4722_09480 [Bacteroidota bacterium]